MYQKLLDQFGYIKDVLVGINEDGEKVIVSIDEESAYVKTLQSNQYARVNIYYPDGREDELYIA